MNAVLPGQARSRRHDRMPARRPAQERKSPSIQGFRSRAARRGRSAGDKACAAPPGTARAGGHSPAGRPAAAVGGAWLVLKSTIRTSLRRHHQPVDLPGNQRRWPSRAASSRPTIETSARLPGANTGAKRRIHDQGQHAFRQRARAHPRSSRRRCGRGSPAQRRGGARGRYRAATAAAGAPACRAAARGRAP